MLAIHDLLSGNHPDDSGELRPRVLALILALKTTFDFSPSRLECLYDNHTLFRT